MDFRQLQIFESVARNLSFSGAGRELHLAQPAVSIAIRKLEDKLELPLFHRADRQVQLTEAGELLLEHARSMLGQRQTALAQMRELKGLDRGEVRVVMPAMHGAYYFPSVFSEFKRLFPGLGLKVIEAGTAAIQQQLLNGDVELGVVMVDRAASDELEVHQFLDEELLAWVPSTHRFASLDSIEFSDFAAEPLVLTHKGYFMRETIDHLGLDQGLALRVEAETNLMLLTRELLLDGIGISTCMRMVADGDPQLIGVPFRPAIHFNMGIAWRRNHYLSAANRAFVEFLLARPD